MSVADIGLQTMDLPEALRRLETHGRLELPGGRCGIITRWWRRRNRRNLRAAAFMFAGLLVACLGFGLFDDGAGLLVGVVGLGVFFGWAAVLAHGLQTQNVPPGLRGAERETVILEARGVTLRGVGPLPWTFFAPPVRMHISTRVGYEGDGAFMPLTPEGVADVNARTWQTQVKVGPKVDRRSGVRHALLPGIRGLDEDEVLDLFTAAYERFAR